MPRDTGWMTLQEIAADVGLAYTALYKWIDDGFFHPHLIGNHKVYSVSEVEKVVQAYNAVGRSYAKMKQKRDEYGI